MPPGDSSAVSGAPSGNRGFGLRYEVYGEIAAGGMASVQYGRLLGPRGFSRAVAIKRLHAHLAKEPEFVTMFVDEARLSARLVHANIIHTLDVIETPGEVALVMEYVHGESLWTLLRLARAEGKQIPLQVACALIASVLHGLHAAHEACDDAGKALALVHRDVSPQNILIGIDGIPRVLDFGIAKALGRLRTTPSGEIKGKLGYIACEQLHGDRVDRRTDVYGASAVLWEALTGSPLFDGPNESAIVHRVLYEEVRPPSAERSEIPKALDEIVLRGLSRDAAARFATAREMALALESSVGLATQSAVTAWLQELAGELLVERAESLAEMQDHPPPDSVEPAPHEQPAKTRPIPRSAPPTEPARVLDESGPRAKRPVSRNARAAALWLVGVLLVASVYAVMWARGSIGSARQAPSAPAIAPPSVAASSAADGPTHVDPPAPQAGTVHGSAADPQPPAPLPPAAAAAKASKPRPARSPRPARAADPQSKPKVSDPSSEANCSLFYYIDDKGIRRPKPECL